MHRSIVLALSLALACTSERANDGRTLEVGAGGGAGASSGQGGTSGAQAGMPESGGTATAGTGGAAVGGSASADVAGQAGSSGTAAVGGAGTSTGGAGGSVSTGSRFRIRAQLASELKETAPTTVGIVTWSFEEPGLTEAHIDFGLDTTYGMTAPVDLSLADYRAVLVGMKPERTYHFRIVATDGSSTYTSDDGTLTTGAPTSEVPLERFEILAAEQLDRGFFISSFWSLSVSGGDSWTAFILDTDGDVVWWYTDREVVTGGELGIARARLSADSRDVWLVQARNGAAPLRRVSIDTLDVETYPDTVGSHDIAAVSGDVMAYLDYGETDCDSIFEIDKAGTVKEVFESGGVFESGRCHGNAVRYSQTEDLYLFSDDRNDVLAVGRDGTVRWRLSERVSGGNASWGGQQHGVQLLDDSILIFANLASTEQPPSQVIEFDLDGSEMRRFTSVAYNPFFGDVQRLPNGNTLIDYSVATLMQVVDQNDEVVLEINAALPFGYVEFRESLYGLPLDIRQ